MFCSQWRRKKASWVKQFLRRRRAGILVGFWRFCLRQPAAELLPEGVQQVRDGFLHADVSLQLSAQRRHAFAFDPTRHDVVEPRQVRVAVQSQAVRRDVAAAVDSWEHKHSLHWGAELQLQINEQRKHLATEE